jgi:hypothetical protein
MIIDGGFQAFVQGSLPSCIVRMGGSHKMSEKHEEGTRIDPSGLDRLFVARTLSCTVRLGGRLEELLPTKPLAGKKPGKGLVEFRKDNTFSYITGWYTTIQI